jgi:hypothetical protein
VLGINFFKHTLGDAARSGRELPARINKGEAQSTDVPLPLRITAAPAEQRHRWIELCNEVERFLSADERAKERKKSQMQAVSRG